MFGSGFDEQLISLLAKAARSEVAFIDDDALLEGVRTLEHCRRLLDAAELRALAQLDVNGTCDARFGMRTAAWLAHECDLPAGVAKRRVRCATTLREQLPATAEALAAGEIGFDHADAITRAANPRIVDDIAGLEHELLAPIPHASFERWHAELRGVAEQIDHDGGYDPRRDSDANQLHKHRGANNGLYLRRSFFGALADQVEQAIDDAADDQFHQHHRDHEQTPDLAIPARSTLQALGLAHLCRLGRANTTRPTGAPADVVVLIEHDPFTANRRATNTAGSPLTDQVMALIGCDAQFATLTVDNKRAVLDMGRTQRLATPEQRNAARARDRGCVFPGCGAHPNHCDIHHIIAWNSGGSTDIVNLASLCRHHHGVTHRTGWTMRANPDQTFTWTTPTGHTLHSQRQQTATGPPGGP